MAFRGRDPAATPSPQEMSRRADELENIPFDEEVRASEQQDRRNARKFARLTRWERVPSRWRVTHCLACACMTASCYLVTYWGENCFAEFAVDDKVSERLGGDPWAIIRPPGLVALALFGIAVLIVVLFHFTWCAGAVKLSPDPDAHLDLSDDEADAKPAGDV